MQKGHDWTFDVKKPNEGLISAGSECGPIDNTIFLGEDNYIKAKFITSRKAEKLRGYLETLVSVIEGAARAYHVERLAFRVLKYTARPRAQYFLRVSYWSLQKKPASSSTRRLKRRKSNSSAGQTRRQTKRSRKLALALNSVAMTCSRGQTTASFSTSQRGSTLPRTPLRARPPRTAPQEIEATA